MTILTDPTGYVYLLHFEEPISDRHTARHYLGYANDLAARLQAHDAGHGSRLTQVARGRGIGWQLVRVWRGGRDLERRLKNGKRGPRLCPICGRGEHVRGLAELSIKQPILPF